MIQKSLDELNQEARYNTRVYFIPPLEGVAKITFSNVEVERTGQTERTVNFFILDSSSGGIRVKARVDLSNHKILSLRILFKLEEERFNLPGVIIRQESCRSNNFQYVIQFRELPPQEKKRLVRCLNIYQMKKTDNQKEQLKTLRERIQGTFLLRFFNVLPFPAFLITQDRMIIAANKYTAGLCNSTSDQCFDRIFNRENICQNCFLEEYGDSRESIGVEVVINERRYVMHWINIKDSIYLHYFVLQDNFPRQPFK